MRGLFIVLLIGCDGRIAAPNTVGIDADLLTDAPAHEEDVGVDHGDEPVDADAPISPTVVAAFQDQPYVLVVDGTAIYWTNKGNGAVMRCPLAGCNGTPETIASMQGALTGIALDKNRVYWTSEGDGGADSGGVSACALAGCDGGPTTLYTGAARGIGATPDGDYCFSGDVTVAMCRSTGCWNHCSAKQAFGCALSGPGAFFWNERASGVVVFGQTDGIFDTCGNEKALATGQTFQSDPLAIVVDSQNGNVYWTASGDGNVMRCALAPMSNPVVVASAQDQPWGLAIDGTNVYWTNNIQNGSVMKVPLGGGKATILATGQDHPHGIAVDATSVYWANTGDGRIMKLPMK